MSDYTSDEEESTSTEDIEDIFESWNILHIDIFRKIPPDDFGVLVQFKTDTIRGIDVFCNLDILRLTQKVNSPSNETQKFLAELVKSLEHEEVRQFLYKYDFLILARYLLRDPLLYCTTVVIEVIASLCQCEIGNIPDYVVNMIEWIGNEKYMATDIVRYINYYTENTPLCKRLVENTLKFFYSVAIVLTTNPTSVWINGLKLCNFNSYILCLLRNKFYDFKNSLLPLTLACKTLVILSEISLPNATESHSMLLNNIFNMQHLIYILYDMQCFDKIHNDSVLANSSFHWEFYKNWLTLIDNVQKNNLFEFDCQIVRNICNRMTMMLDSFLKTLRTSIRNLIKQPNAFFKPLEHINIVYKCMRLAENFKKDDDYIHMIILQVTCGIEHKILTIRLILDKLYDIFDSKLKFSELQGNVYSETNTNLLDLIDNAKEQIDQYLDTAIEQQSEHFSSFRLLFQLCIEIQKEYDKEVRAVQYIEYVQNRISYITRNVNDTEPNRLRQTFNRVKQEIEKYFL